MTVTTPANSPLRRLGLVTAIAAASLLAACGGGGGGDAVTGTTPTTPTTPTPPSDLGPGEVAVAAGLQRILTGDWEFSTANGRPLKTADGQYRLEVRQARKTDGAQAFENVAATPMLMSQALSSPIGSILSRSTTYYSAAAPFHPLGVTYDFTSASSPVTYVVITRTGDLPTKAKVGDTGPYYFEVRYNDASKTTFYPALNTNWSVEAGTSADTYYVCLNQDAGTKWCYLMDATGALKGLRVTQLLTDGSSLVFSS